MKKITLIPLLVFIVACHSVRIPTKYGTASVDSIGQKVSIGGLQMGEDGTLSVTNYNLDQVSGIQAIGAVAAQAFAAGAMGAQNPNAPVGVVRLVPLTNGLFRLERPLP